MRDSIRMRFGVYGIRVGDDLEGGSLVNGEEDGGYDNKIFHNYYK